MAEQFQNNANRYQFFGMIGKGPLGDVYRVMDNFFRIELAFKTLHPEAAQPELINWFSNRYAQDVNILSKLGNPNIIKLHDFTSYNGIPSWTMDLLSGVSYAQYCGKPLPYSQAASLLVPVADALAFAHQRGIIHGNLKPSNILINNQNQPVLTDWGLTRWLSENGRGYTAFEAQYGIGSPEYLAPEQAQGSPIDPRTDIYSLGIIFYELVTGRRPFTAVSPLETMSHQVSDQLPAPRYFAPNISQQAEQLMYQATAKNPMGRLNSMGEFALALRNIAADSSNGSYFPPASYYANANNIADDDDDDEGSPMGDLLNNITAFFGSLGHNKKNLVILLAAVALLLALIIGVSASNSNKKKIAAFNATATQEASEREATATAIQESMEQQKQATENALTQLIVASTQSALEAQNAAAAAQQQAIPTVPVIPVEIPQEALPTASNAGTGRFQSQSPQDGKNLTPGQAFDMNWTIENTGNNKWDLNHKLVFLSGTNFATGQITESKINQEIWPRGAGAITLKCTAPTTLGTYSMQWALTDADGNTIFSPLGISINVVEGEPTATPDGDSEYIDDEVIEFIEPETDSYTE